MSLTTLLDPAVRLAQVVLTDLVRTLPPGLSAGARTALAVVLVTWAVRALLFPLSLSAARSRAASLAVADEVAAIRTRHPGDPAQAGRELRALYTRAGVRPFAGLLPLLVQLPLIGTLYRLVTVPTVAGLPNPVLAAVLFGVPLGGHWPQLLATAGVLSPAAACLTVLLLGLTLVAVLSARRIGSAATSSGPNGGVTTEPAGTGVAAAEPVTRILRVMPFLTVGFAVLVPPAVGVYLLASTTWTLLEQSVLTRLG